MPDRGMPLSSQKIVIDPVQLGKLAELCCSIEEVAAFFRCSTATIRHRIKREPMKTIWESGLARGRISLRRAQLQAAYAGDRTMLVWLGKQLLGQVDKVEQTVDTKQRFVVEIPPPMTAKEWINAYGKQGEDAIDVTSDKSTRPQPKSRSRANKSARMIDSSDYTEVVPLQERDKAKS